jgi:PAS domain-containing protein
MSWSQTPQSQDFKDLHDQMTILVGSAIRLLGGEAGVFIVSNEAFDPQSHAEYTQYGLNEEALPLLFTHIQESMQPNSRHPLVIEALEPTLALQIGIEDTLAQGMKRYSFALYDLAGSVGALHVLRAARASSCFEQDKTLTEADGMRGELHLYTAQFATSLRFALKSQSLVREQDRLAAIFRYSTEGILTVDHALRIIDFNPAMERLTGWQESEVLGQFYFKVLRPKDRQGNDLGLQDSPILQAFAGQNVMNR